MPLALGLASGPQGGALTDNPTHKVTVYTVFGTPPADLAENRRVTIDGIAYTILRNGIQRDAGTWTVYLRAVRETVRP
ncbi:hypothetical protein [Deinococcus multiflagellatus]|uniref:Head-tail adaptor protein n=1 Tax=Deinococcus multiflagellatus TaxID=1656887 RepID=A0ABW1ZEZ2_9DEIO